MSMKTPRKTPSPAHSSVSSLKQFDPKHYNKANRRVQIYQSIDELGAWAYLHPQVIDAILRHYTGTTKTTALSHALHSGEADSLMKLINPTIYRQEPDSISNLLNNIKMKRKAEEEEKDDEEEKKEKKKPDITANNEFLGSHPKASVLSLFVKEYYRRNGRRLLAGLDAEVSPADYRAMCYVELTKRWGDYKKKKQVNGPKNSWAHKTVKHIDTPIMNEVGRVRKRHRKEKSSHRSGEGEDNFEHDIDPKDEDMELPFESLYRSEAKAAKKPFADYFEELTLNSAFASMCKNPKNRGILYDLLNSSEKIKGKDLASTHKVSSARVSQVLHDWAVVICMPFWKYAPENRRRNDSSATNAISTLWNLRTALPDFHQALRNYIK